MRRAWLLPQFALPLGARPLYSADMKVYRVLFWLCAFASAACLALGGWMWWNERDLPLLVVDRPVHEVGDVPCKEGRTLEISVTNTSSHPLRLAGLDGELC